MSKTVILPCASCKECVMHGQEAAEQSQRPQRGEGAVSRNAHSLTLRRELNQEHGEMNWQYRTPVRSVNGKKTPKRPCMIRITLKSPRTGKKDVRKPMEEEA